MRCVLSNALFPTPSDCSVEDNLIADVSALGAALYKNTTLELLE
jgi:hypothetical protein